MRRSVFLLLSSIVIPWTPSMAQESTEELLTVGHYLDWERVSNPQISPDGRHIVYTRAWVDKMDDDWKSSIWVMSSDGSRNRFLVEGSNPRWSPDGTRIAFLAPGEPQGQQLFVRWMDAEGAVTQVTREGHAPVNHRWAHDGESLLFARLVPTEEDFAVDLPGQPEGADWTLAPKVIDKVHYRFDRRGFLEEGYMHLFRVPADGGTARQLTAGSWSVGPVVLGGPSFDVTPDGRFVVFDGLMSDADQTYRETHIYRLELATGRINRLTDQKGPWNSPVVSPDGRMVAFKGFEWTPQTFKAEELHVVGIDGGSVRRISGDLDRSPMALSWAGDGGGVYFSANNHGTRNLHFAPIDGSGPRQVTHGSHMLTLVSFSDEGTAVGVRTAPHEPGDVVAVRVDDPDQLDRLTAVNDDVLEGKQLGEVEEVWYESSGGAQVQGWIVKPPHFDPEQRYPLILHIHGGPHAMYNVGFSYAYQNFAANGFVVLYTNPRGSTGYGTEFGNAIDNGYPSVDYDDLMAGVDAVLDRGYVDPTKLYVTGCSGGGVLSSWVIGHTDRFAGAGVRCPVINWMSFAGTADVTVWGYYRYDGYPWTNPDKYLQHSPLMYADKVTTPTLLMTGELDLRTPMAQTEEYYQALKAEGVETKMLRFHEEYHGTGSKPSNFMRTQLFLMKWFEEHVRGQPVASRN